MFEKVEDPDFIAGEHAMLRLWREADVFGRLQRQNAGKPKWSFLDGPITANNPMGVHHAWGRTYKDAYQRYHAMTGHELRYQNGFDCQGLWVEVEVEKELNLGTKSGIADYGIDRFVWECKKRVLRFAARQTEQSIRLGYWMEWDHPDELRKLAEAIGNDSEPFSRSPSASASSSTLDTRHSSLHSYHTARGQSVTAPAEQIAAQLGNPTWGGSYFTFSTENNETIWSFLKKCFERKKIYQGHDVMPWSGRAGSAYSQMEVADGRKLTTHRSCFVRFRLRRNVDGLSSMVDRQSESVAQPSTINDQPEYLLVWTTTPWTLTSNVACAVDPDLEYVRLRAKKDGAVYYFAKDNLDSKRLEKEFKEGFGRPEWGWPEGVGKLKSIAQIFKEQGGYEIEGTLFGRDMIGWRYEGPFDQLPAQQAPGGSQLLAMAVDDFIHGPLRESPPFTEQDIRPTLPDGLNPTNWARQIRDLFWERVVGLLEQASALGWISPRDEDLSRNGVYVYLTNLALSSDTQFLLNCILDAEELTYIESGNHTWLPGVDRESYVASLWKWIKDWSGASQRNALLPEFLAELRMKQKEYLKRALEELTTISLRSGAKAHRIIDGGRDSKGNPIVVAGEGTGIVHIAPGCGDVDHQIGKQLGLPIIAPLLEDGTFDEGFGPFTGRRAIDPETAQLVFDSLKDKGLLVAVESYPHIYPFCWRTGDELVFRLVDEWFINMDWRDEIKDVTQEITWLPPSVEGRERELEWLSNMRDWMISKKRFWGLALPIWVNPHDSTDFEVIGSLAELKERALACHGDALPDGSRLNSGWDEFEGHTPHRPWIDAVKIKSRRTGAVLSRIVDVGNPWLDAGIVPFSTLNYRGSHGEDAGNAVAAGSLLNADPTLNAQHSTLNWREWYPPDFVVECFPGQFRNWFYSLLALSTMMRYDETDDPAAKRPFQTLLGHRLVMNEDGKPMHKSDGTAIWFEEAAEQLGVDTLRWLYLAQDPAADLRFGTRHPDEPVTLPTPDGPAAHTREGLACCRVTSQPADEVRRQVLIPLWNSYSFFVNYARLDGFAPSLPPVAVAERPEIDQWILSNLQAFLQTANDRFQAYDVAEVCHAAAAFIDDLSNWYIRRNRRRFWRSRDDGVKGTKSVKGAKSTNSSHPSNLSHSSDSPSWDADKLAAYQTLYTVLVTLTKALAPAIPFITERMYQNLVVGDRSSVFGDVQEPQPPAFSGEPKATASPLPPTHDPRPTDSQPSSVHLCSYPQPDASLLRPELNRRTALAQRVVRMGHRLREQSDRRVRQPLAELRYACSSARDAADLAALADVIADELNVKRLTQAVHLDELVHYSYKPNLKTLGPKYGKLLSALRQQLPELGDAVLRPLRTGEPVTVSIAGQDVQLAPEDVMISTEQASDWAVADEPGIQIALSIALTPELVQEGMARDFVRQVQQARKDANLEITDRIEVMWSTTGEDRAAIAAAVEAWRAYIARETLADAVDELPPGLTEAEDQVTLSRFGAFAEGRDARDVSVGNATCMLAIKPVRAPIE